MKRAFFLWTIAFLLAGLFAGWAFAEQAIVERGWIESRIVPGGVAVWIAETEAVRDSEGPSASAPGVVFFVQFEGVPQLPDIPDPRRPASLSWNKERGAVGLSQGDWRLTWSVKSRQPAANRIVGVSRHVGNVEEILSDLESPVPSAGTTPDDMCSAGGQGSSQCAVTCAENRQCETSCVQNFYACCYCGGPLENRPRSVCKVYTPRNT